MVDPLTPRDLPVFPLTPAQWAAIPLDDRETRDGRRFTYFCRLEPAPSGGYRETPVRVEVGLRERIPVALTGSGRTCGVQDHFGIERLSEVVCLVCGQGRGGASRNDYDLSR